MKKFILLTFAFLAWAGYEMSGGSEFVPASARMASNVTVVETAELEQAPESVDIKVVPAKKPVVDTDPPLKDSATRVSLNLTTLKQTADDAPADTAAADTGAAASVAKVNGVFGVPENADGDLNSADTPAIIPSLIVPDATGAAVQSVSLTSADGDVRTVSGNTVNVRGGPGTDYEVVTKLRRGDAVQVLVDDGDGWVKMRPLDGGEEGWMADFLLVGG